MLCYKLEITPTTGKRRNFNFLLSFICAWSQARRDSGCCWLTDFPLLTDAVIREQGASGARENKSKGAGVECPPAQGRQEREETENERTPSSGGLVSAS